MRQHLVVTVHGIRTHGGWQDRLAALVKAADPAATVYSYKYNYYSALGFLIPLRRWFAARHFQRQLIALRRERRWDRIDIVAHSFGTHIVGWALQRMPAQDRPAIDTIIFAGSVLKQAFPWYKLWPGPVRRVVNECGIRDSVLVLNQLCSLLTGLAGREGFIGIQSSHFANRHHDCGHSGYFADPDGRDNDFMARHWVPLLTSEEPIPRIDERPALTATRGVWEVVVRNLSLVKILMHSSLVAALVLYAGTQYQARRQALSVRKANQALDNLWLSPQKALRDATEATAIWPTDAARRALSAAMSQSRVEAVMEQPWPGSRPPVTAAAYSPDGRYILSSDRYAQVCVWDSTTYRLVQCMRTFGGFRISEQAMRGDDLLLSGPTAQTRGVENFFPLLRVRTSTVAAEVLGGAIRGMLTMAAWTPKAGHEVIAWSSVNQRAYVKDLASGKVNESSRHPDIVNSVRFSTDGDWLVTASQDGHARVFSVRHLKQPIELSAGSTAMFDAQFHPCDPSVVVTAGQDGMARLWTIANGKAGRVRVVGEHQEEVRSAAFGKAGTVVITASVDGTARIWSVSGDGKTPLLSLTGHRQSLTSAALSPDGDHAVTASGDGTVRVWNVGDIIGSGDRTLSCRRTALGRPAARAITASRFRRSRAVLEDRRNAIPLASSAPPSVRIDVTVARNSG